MKTIVTHIGPDVDAVTSVWLVKTFFPDWEEAALAFVPAGETLGGKDPDSDPDIWHVDTGLGAYDHHQSNSDTCAAMLVFEEVKRLHGDDPPLERLVRVVNDLDHFRNVMYPNPTADFWDFGLEAQVDGWRLMYADTPIKIIELGMNSLDAVYKTFQNKVWAEKEIKEKGQEFETRWGKAVGVETTNDEVIHLGQKLGYALAVRKDPKKGYLRIKSLPRNDIDLTHVYQQLKSEEPDATWFLHASRHMVLNGSSKNPNMRPTKKSLSEIIEVLKHE